MTSLQERIYAQLELALVHHERAGIESLGRRGLAGGGPDEPVIRLSLQDVARIAASVAQEQ